MVFEAPKNAKLVLENAQTVVATKRTKVLNREQDSPQNMANKVYKK